MSVLPSVGTKNAWGAYLLADRRGLRQVWYGVVHDEFLARCAVWVAGFVEEPGIYGHCGVDAGPGDRGEYGAFFGSEWRFAKSAAVSGSRPTRPSVLEHTLL